MVQLTLTPINKPAEAITLDVTVAYSAPPAKERRNQKSIVVYSGDVFTTDIGRTFCTSQLFLKALTSDQWYLLEGFIVDTLNFNEEPFSIGINGCGSIDLGLGRGIDVPLAKLGEDFTSTDGIAQHRAPDIYHVTFPFFYALEE